MATVGFGISADFNPAYYSLLDCYSDVVAAHGEGVADEWFLDIIQRDPELFIKTNVGELGSD